MKFYQLFCNGKVDPIGISADVRLQWSYVGSSKRGEKQTAFRLIVLNASEQPFFDSGIIESSDMQYELSEKDGLQYGQLYYWKIQAFSDTEEINSEWQSFEIAIHDLESSPWIGCGLKQEEEPAAPIFQKSFISAEDVISARVYITGLGLISCKINDVDCNKGLLTPPHTDYPRQVYFETLDITAYLKDGENHLDIQLGNGYNKDYSQWGCRYFTPKGFRAAIVLKYFDGKIERIDTDESWTWRNSCITANGLYLGEEYDARLSFDTAYPAVMMPEAAPEGVLLPDEMPPLKIIEERYPVAQWEINGRTVYDFGKNIQGFCRIGVEAPEGCVISMQHAEMITPEGELDTFTNRRARARDIYTCSGKGIEVYRPAFTYHGFRYVAVEHSMPVKSFHIKALFLSADVGEKAVFQCSEPILNRMHELCTNSIRANLVSFPTDCPMRDERTPCLMDSQMYEDAAMYNFNMYAYYKKWLHDNTVGKERLAGNMDWNGDSLMLAYRMYLFYGDTGLAKELYPMLKKTVRCWFDESENGVWTKGYGDWCIPNKNTWESFFGCPYAINTSLLHAYTGIMAEFAALFGYVEDQQEFLAIGKRIREAFVTQYWHEDGTVGEGRQTEMFTPLFYGVLNGVQAEKTKHALLKKIREDRFFDVGGFGLRAVLPVLSDADALDLFLETVRYNHYPGFGYWVAMGATSLWEQWESKGTMHSHNHAMHAGINAALFQTLCGIVPTAPTFRSFRIAPKLPSDMRYVQCKLETYSGTIAMSLERIGDTLVMSCLIPPNTEAELRIPDLDAYDTCVLFDGERKIEKTETMRLGSGQYQFRLIPKEYVDFQAYPIRYAD